MAGRKPAARGRSGGTRQGSAAGRSASSSARQSAGVRQGGGRSGDGRTGSSGQGAAKTGGPGAVAGKSRSAGNGAAPAKSASASTAAARPGSGAQASQAPAGPVGRLLAPFRSMGGLPLATFILSLYGLGASIYLTLTHYDTHIVLACSDKGLVNCAEVTTSAQSMVFGVLPVAVLGLAFYVFMVAFNSPWGWRLQQPAARWARLGSVVVGMGFVLYLVYAEVVQIGAICLWCTSVHVATFLIFALTVFYASFSWGKPLSAGRG
jgi:uncharacterized membrane protein